MRIPQRTCSFRQRLDSAVVTRQEHVGNTPAPELGRTRVVRMLEPTSDSVGERLVSPEPSARAPGSRRAIASTSTIAGRSPFERTYGPIEIESVRDARRSARRSPRNGRRGASACSSFASSSTTSCVSCRPCGLSAITRCVGPAAVDGVERRRDDVDPQHHPGAAAVGLVVDAARPQRRRRRGRSRDAGRARRRGRWRPDAAR